MSTLTETELATIRRRHSEGASLSAIARELGRSPSTVSKRAKAMGLAWDAAQTRAATTAKQASNAERRAELVRRLYDRADKIMDRLDAPQFKYVGENWGAAVVTEIPADAIPGAEERALLGMVVNAITGAARLEAVDAGSQGVEQARGLLGALGDALQGAYGQLAHTGNTPSSEAVERDLAD